MSKRNAQPMQPVIVAKDRVHRFKRNAIVCWVLDALDATGRKALNEIAVMPFTQDDREQFAQLIGYSVSGFGDLSYVRDATYEKAAKASRRLLRKKRK